MYREIAVTYYLDEKGRKEAILKGMNGKKEQVMLVPVTPELLEIAEVDSQGNIIVNATVKKVYKVKETYRNIELIIELDDGNYSVVANVRYPTIDSKTETIYFGHVPTQEELYNFILEKYAEEKENYKKAEEEYETKLKEFEEKILPQIKENEKKKLQEKLMEKRKEKEEKEKKLIEKKEWISKYGSEYLKKAYSEGFDCKRRYVKERAAREFPDFIVDFDDEARWKERSCPSETALNEMIELKNKGYNAKVVWLTWLPANLVEEDEEYYEFEEQEALVIENYLGEYTLVKLY